MWPVFKETKLEVNRKRLKKKKKRFKKFENHWFFEANKFNFIRFVWHQVNIKFFHCKHKNAIVMLNKTTDLKDNKENKKIQARLKNNIKVCKTRCRWHKNHEFHSEKHNICSLGLAFRRNQDLSFIESLYRKWFVYYWNKKMRKTLKMTAPNKIRIYLIVKKTKKN